MLAARDIKDKRITKAGLAFVCEVYLYDGRVIDAGRHLTLYAAQKALSRFPNDVFEGSDDPSHNVRWKSAKPRVTRTEEQHANWETPEAEPFSRLYDWRC